MKSVTKYSPSKMEPVSVNQLVDIIFFWFMLEPVPLLNIFIYFFEFKRNRFQVSVYKRLKGGSL